MLAGHGLLVLRLGDEVGGAEAAAALDDGQLLEVGAAVDQLADERVAGLVLGRLLEFGLGAVRVPLLAAHRGFVECELDVVVVGGVLALEDGVDQGLVDHVGDLGAAHAGGLARDLVQFVLGVTCEGALAHLVFEHVFAPVFVGQRDFKSAVEAPGPQERLVERVNEVGGADHEDVLVLAEAVHLREHLVERLPVLVGVPALPAAAECVQLVDEDDARFVLARQLEQVPYSLRADPHLHLVERAPAAVDEGLVGLARQCLRDQRFAGARRAVEQDALRQFGAPFREVLLQLHEPFHFLQIVYNFVDALDVVEFDV